MRGLLTGNDALDESHDEFKENGECLPNTGEDRSKARAYAPEQTNDYVSVFALLLHTLTSANIPHIAIVGQGGERVQGSKAA